MVMRSRELKLKEEAISEKIYFLRGEKILLDRDLALLYGVETKVLKQAVRRNRKRFPEDFLYVLNRKEHDFLRSQFVTLERGKGKHSKYLPFAFTEQGVAMLSSVLNSDRAIEVNIAIMRTFVKMRSLIYSNLELKEKLKELERITNDKFKENDKKIKLIFVFLESAFFKKAQPSIRISFPFSSTDAILYSISFF